MRFESFHWMNNLISVCSSHKTILWHHLSFIDVQCNHKIRWGFKNVLKAVSISRSPNSFTGALSPLLFCSLACWVLFSCFLHSVPYEILSVCMCVLCECVFVLLPGLGWSRQHPYCPWAETPPNHIHMWWIKHDIEIVPGLSAAGQFCWPVSESHRQVRTNLGHCKPIWKRHVSIYRGWVNQQVQNDPAWVPRLPQLREI